MTNITSIGTQLADIADKVSREATLTANTKTETLAALAKFRDGVNEAFDKTATALSDQRQVFNEAADAFSQALADEYTSRQSALVEIVDGPATQEAA